MFVGNMNIVVTHGDGDMVDISFSEVRHSAAGGSSEFKHPAAGTGGSASGVISYAPSRIVPNNTSTTAGVSQLKNASAFSYSSTSNRTNSDGEHKDNYHGPLTENNNKKD